MRPVAPPRNPIEQVAGQTCPMAVSLNGKCWLEGGCFSKTCLRAVYVKRKEGRTFYYCLSVPGARQALNRRSLPMCD
jgi:hypothetical protein